MASTYLSKTFGTATDRKKFTVSLWFKRSGLSSTQMLFAGTNGSTDEFVYLSGSNNIIAECASGQLVSSAVFRDTNAWYHVVYKFDSAQATAGDRTALYVNGTEISYSTETQPSQNATPNFINNSNLHAIGRRGSSADAYFDGSITHFHFCDGYAYSASDFGETDATTGIWKPKTAPSVTYGTNGFFLKFESSGTMGLDSSINTNTFTVNGTLRQTVDTPSNVFATLNAVKKLTGTLSNGNTTWTGNGDNGVWSTIGNNSGKWYWETKNNANSIMCGIASEDVTQATSRSENTGVYGVQNGSTYAFYRNNGSSGQSSGFPDPTTSNIVCHALDLDNGKYFVGVDGVFKNLSGTTSNLGTGADPTFTGLDTAKFWFPFIECRSNSAGANINFGNGYFGTTPVSSAGSNGNGAIFEYDVPTGYYALNTKNINTYG
jgi:hypothetical protein